MGRKASDTLFRLDTVGACHQHIRGLQRKIERLDLAAKQDPIRGYQPYKVLGYHCSRLLSHDDSFGVYAEFQTLAEAVVYCRKRVDHQIAHWLAEAENGLITSPRQIDDAIAELVSTGGCFWVTNVMDPTVRNSFESRAYARDRLEKTLMRKKK